MTITALTTFSLIEYFNSDEIGSFVPCNNHLSNTLAIINDEIFVTKIYEQYHHLPAIISIHRSWSVENCQSMLKCQSTTWTYLRLETSGQSNM